MFIGICEDNKKELERLENLLRDYRTPGGNEIRFRSFAGSFDLIDSMSVNAYDALILDILMPGQSGVDAARDIRVRDQAIPIVFLTSSPEFAVESYRVNAYDYILKPVVKDRLYETLDRIYGIIASSEELLSVDTPKSVFRIAYNTIEFIEVNNRTITFHTSDGKEKSVSGHLFDFEEVLVSRPEFLKVHRSFVVNLNLMKSLENKEFTALSGKTVPISRNLVTEVRDSFVKHLHGTIRT
ncbi:MAG: LytTR family DNA-binding domain-containing protein [Lachnospiraceae bacterium]|nr:LytTR family DNA-binding domain-containing protein [Lachnospiraceae bacterium]